MSKRFFTLIFGCICLSTYAQNFNNTQNVLANYIQRMYEDTPFEGARVITDYDNSYLITVVTETPSGNEYILNRKAEVKGLNYANTFLNGAEIYENTIIHMVTKKNGDNTEDIESFIHARSMGYVQTMQLLTTFTAANGKKVFIYCKQLPMPEKQINKKKRKK